MAEMELRLEVGIVIHVNFHHILLLIESEG